MQGGCRASNIFLLGLLAIVGGLASAVLAPKLRGGNIQDFWRLQASSAADVRSSTPGSYVLVEGVLEGNKEVYKDLVAYVRTVSNDIGRETTIVTEERVNPPLTLALADGTVRLEGDYRMQKTHLAIGAQGREAFRRSGLSNGDRVVAVGRVAPGGVIEADLLLRGKRFDFIADRIGSLGAVYVGSCCAVLLGVLFVLFAMLSWRAGRRAPSA